MDFFVNIPNQAWIVISGVFGGAITLAVTFIQSKGETYRLSEKLAHDKALHRADREMTMRREVYYSALDYLYRAIALLGPIDI